MLLFPSICLSQSDSLRIARLETEVHEIKLNLGKSHREHNVGVGFALAGSIITTLAATQIQSKKYHYENNMVMLAGSVITFSGFWLIFDSHKFIGKASE